MVLSKKKKKIGICQTYCFLTVFLRWGSLATGLFKSLGPGEMKGSHLQCENIKLQLVM